MNDRKKLRLSLVVLLAAKALFFRGCGFALLANALSKNLFNNIYK